MTTEKANSPYGAMKFKNIDEYHSNAPEKALKLLDELRELILSAAPGCEETISYNMPAFRLKKTLVYYAVHKMHIGFYPTSSPIVFFKDELSDFKFSKGAVQFPLDQPLPKALIKKMVQFRVTEVEKKSN